MDIQVKNYSFNKTAKTVTFSDYTTIRLDSIRMIANTTAGILIYTFASAALKGTVLNNVLTLVYDTSAMADTDKLQIIYNDDTLPATANNQSTEMLLIQTLNELAARLQVLTGMANAGAPALRVIPIGGTSAVTGTFYQTTQPVSQALIGSHPANVIAQAQNNEAAIISNINNIIAK